MKARVRCGDLSELSIFKRPPVATEHTLAHVEVTDIEAVVADLEAKGVEFLDYTAGPLVTTGHSRRSVPRAAPGCAIPTETRSACVRHYEPTSAGL